LQVRFSGEGVRSSRGQPARAGVRANSDRHGSPVRGTPPPRRATWPSCSSAAASSPPLLGAAHPQSPHKPAPGSVARLAVAAQFAQLPPPSARRGVGIGQSYPLIPLTGAFVHHLPSASTISRPPFPPSRNSARPAKHGKLTISPSVSTSARAHEVSLYSWCTYRCSCVLLMRACCASRIRVRRLEMVRW
jgi:hypothetical protein